MDMRGEVKRVNEQSIREAQQTTIELHEDGGYHVCTPNGALIRRLEAAGAERLHTEDAPSPGGEQWYSVPAAWVRITPPRNTRKAKIQAPAGLGVGGVVDIWWSEAAREAVICTDRGGLIRRLCGFGFRPEPIDDYPGEYSFVVPKASVKIRPPAKASPAQMEARRAAGKRLASAGRWRA